MKPRNSFANTPKQAQAQLLVRHDGRLAFHPLVVEICEILEDYPLAITVAAPQLGPPVTGGKGLSLKELQDALRNNMPDALAHTRAQGLPERLKSVRASLDLSYQRLSSDRVRELWSHIAVFPGGAAQEMLAALEDVGWREAAEELCFRNLMREQDGRYRMLAPIRADALTRRPADALDAYRLRGAEWLLRFAAAAAQAMSGPAATKALQEQVADEAARRALVDVIMLQGRDALTRERANVLEAIRWADRLKQDALLIGLVEAIEDFLNLGDERVTAREIQTLALEAAQRLGDPLTIGQRWHALGRTHYLNADMQPALDAFDQAAGFLAAPPADADESARKQYILGEADVLQAQGDVLYFLKRTPEALEKYDAALSLFRTVGARLGEANVLFALGRAALASDEADRGLALLEQTRQLYETVGDRAGQSNVAIALARHAAARGDLQAAIEYMQPAVDFGLEINHPLASELQAEIDRWKAQLTLQQALQDPATLRPLLEQAATEARATSDTGRLADILALLAETCEKLADWQAVVAACDELLILRPDDLNALYRRAAAQHELRNWSAARADYARLTELAPNAPEAWNGLGNAHTSLGDHAATVEAYTRALALAPDQPHLYRNRADALIELGRLEEAEADCQKAQELDPENPRTAGRGGQLRVVQRRFAEAEPLLRTAIAGTRRDAIQSHSYADWGGWLALALLGQKKMDEAQEAYQAWAQTASPEDRAAWARWRDKIFD